MSRSITIAIVAVVALTAGAWGGMTAARRSDALPRTSDGKPDLNGIWQVANTANWDLQTHGAAAGPPALGALGAIPPGPGVVEGDEIPYLPAALAKKDENFANRWTADPEVKCYLPGVPRATYLPQPFQIFQSPGRMLIAYQFAGATRIINMDAATEAPIDSWMGWSNGRWDGDTLVVDVTGFNGQAWLDRAGNYHSDALHVVERYTMTGPDLVMYEATLEDPTVFSRPWTIRMPLHRRVDAGARLMEFKCIEYTEELLYGHLRKQPRQ